MHDNERHDSPPSAPTSRRRVLFGVWLAVAFGAALLIGRWLHQPPTPAPPAAALQLHRPAAPAPAQATAITITGQVLSAAGVPLSGASVTASAQGLPNPIEAVTDAAGNWSLTLTAPSPTALWDLRFAARDHVAELLAGYSPTAEPLTVELRAGGGVTGHVTVNAVGVAGATVHIAGPGLWPPVDVVTGPHGGFVTPPIPEGRYFLLARSSTHGTVATIDHNGRPDSDPVEVPMLEAGTLRVSVVGPPHALVTIAEDTVHVLSLPQWTAEGAATFQGLPPGNWVVRVRAPGYQEKIERVRTSAVDAELALTPEPAGTIRGRVTAGGEPALLVQIVAHATTQDGGQWLLRRDPTGSIQSRATPQGGGTPSAAAAFGWFTDEDGSFELSGLPAGQIVVEASQPGFQPAWAGPFQVDAGTVVEGVDLTLVPGLSLTVLVEGPISPLAVARVDVAPADAPRGNRTLPAAFAGDKRELVTNEAGLAVAEGLPQRVQVRAFADGYVEASQTVDIPSLAGEPLVLRLTAPGARTRGRVLLGGVLPMAGVDLHRIAPPGTPVSVTACRANTDDDGIFELIGCPEGAVTMMVIPPRDRGAPTLVDLVTGSESEVSVEAPVTATIRLQNPVGEPVRGATLTIDPQGGPAWSRDVTRSSTVSNDDGIAEFAGLAKGGATLMVNARGYQAHKQTLSLPDADTIIALRPTIALTGAVVDRYGAPVADARVRIPGFTTSSGDRGEFDLELTRGAPVRVVAIHPTLGRGEAVWTPGDAPLRVELNAATIDLEQWGERLRQAGLTLWEDGARIVVEDVDETAHTAGARRGDVLLDVSADGEGLRLEAERDQGTVRYRF